MPPRAAATPSDEPVNLALSDAAARQLANATKTTAQLDTITPRWLTRLLQWVPVEAGIYRLNRVKDPQDVEIACPPRDESELPQTYVEYDESPREAILPHTVEHAAIPLDLKAILGWFQSRYPGAMYSGCGGGYMIVVSEEPVPGSLRVRVRLG